MSTIDINTGLLAFGLPGGAEWIILLVLGLLIFGRRLPEVGRSIGASIVEFKRGIKGITDEIDEESSRPGREALPDDRTGRTLPEENRSTGTATGEPATAGSQPAE